MKHEQRLKALTRLAATDSAGARAALGAEIDKIVSSFENDSLYDTLEGNIEALRAFEHRFAAQAKDALLALAERLKGMEITYSEDQGFPDGFWKEYRNSTSLTVSVIEALNQLRYLETEAVLSALMNFYQREEEDVKSKALEGLKLVSNFDLAVFYGPDGQSGVGPKPQIAVIEFLEALEPAEIKKYFEPILEMIDGLLSPTMETTTSTYNTVTWSNAAVPALPEVVNIRDRSISVLKNLYEFVQTEPEKLSVVSCLNQAARTHRGGAFEKSIQDMIAANTISVHEFFKDLIDRAPLSVVQKIEHDTYWRFYHALTAEVAESALSVKQAIAENSEYSIFKILVGFEGIFGEWEDLKNEDDRWEKVDDYRKQKASEFAQKIDDKNFDEWRSRIIEYSKVESNDLATFPILYGFLNEFAKSRPDLAQKLVEQDTHQLEKFLIPLLRGIWDTPQKQSLLDLVYSWVELGEYLYPCGKMFIENDALDFQLLAKIWEKAVDLEDSAVLNLIASVAVSNISANEGILLEKFFIPSIRELTKLSDASWLQDTWYRKEMRYLVNVASEDQTATILANLILVDEIDYHADQILAQIAARFPLSILTFFRQRLELQKENGDRLFKSFDAIPYELHKLKEPLSKIPVEAVDEIRGWYDQNYGMFIYGGARLLKLIFPDLPSEFETKLWQIAESGANEDLEFVLAVLRNYDGNPIIHETCREIVKILPSGDPLLNEVAIALESTGTVVGEYGLAEAYERKAVEIEKWCHDSNEKVRAFATGYVESLQKLSVSERQRADEEIEVRKYTYGE